MAAQQPEVRTPAVRARDWFVTIDSRRAVLYSCKRTQLAGLHVEPVQSMENEHFHEHERNRPGMLGGNERGGVAASGASAAPHLVSPGHETEEEQRRFAREVALWLGVARKELGVDHLVVFAPGRLLAMLKREIDQLPANGQPWQVVYHDAELARLRPHELAEHSAVRKLVELQS